MGEPSTKRDSKTFSIDRLFEAAASGDARNLDGLHQYLHQNMKKLSDSLCECDTHHATAAPNSEHVVLCVISLNVWLHLQISRMVKLP